MTGGGPARPRRLAVARGPAPGDVLGAHRRAARRLTVVVGEPALALDVVALAHAAGAGAVHLMHGVGATAQAPDGPSFMIVIVADPESADDLVRQLTPLLGDGLLVTDDVVETVSGAAGPG